MGVLTDSVEGRFHGAAHALLIDVAHVEYLESGLPDKAFFAFVDAANADLADHRRPDGRASAAYASQLVGTIPTQHSQRHAMGVAGGAKCLGIEIGISFLVRAECTAS